MPEAAVFEAPGRPLVHRSFDAPTLGAGELLVEVDLCTLCGSDLHTLRGARAAPTPSILGHEAVGRVQDAGPDAPAATGDRVTWSIAASCGTCERCTSGLEQKCTHLWKYGHEACTAPSELSGGLAEAIHLRAGTTVVPVPDHVPDEVAAPANCATATVAAALRSAEGVEGREVLVLGAGLLGLTAAAMARSGGAARVAVVDPDPVRRALAARFGADETSAPGGDAAADVVIELSGQPEAVEEGLVRAGLGARVVLVGSVSPSRPVALDPERVVRGLVRIEGVHNYRPQDLGAAVEFLGGPGASFPFVELVGAVYPLAQVDRAVAEALTGAAVRVGVRP
ncbi:MAG: zinc-binding dehydrogenase [Planctomycetota bacterium]|jgi:putative phosphonate catabolism associated alcohol dehydrogenase|nr:zinc-binding dehydrogenase [Planctomycetota bacterium]